MSFIVEMVRGKHDEDNFHSFYLDVWTWRTLLEFGKANGCNQKGTLPDEQYSATSPEYMKHFKNDYEPKEWGLSKMFDATDALALAEALRLGIQRVLDGKIQPPVRDGPSLLNSETGYASPDVSNNRYLAQAESLAKFLAGGSFIFAFDD